MSVFSRCTVLYCVTNNANRASYHQPRQNQSFSPKADAHTHDLPETPEFAQPQDYPCPLEYRCTNRMARPS
jgi:hypothetical protein